VRASNSTTDLQGISLGLDDNTFLIRLLDTNMNNQ